MSMFSSNQVFQISGELEYLPNVLDFAIKQSGNHQLLTRHENPCSLVYQITDNGRYCLASALSKDDQSRTLNDGWHDYPFDYDPKIIAGIIQQWIQKQPTPKSKYENWDGGHDVGFLCEALWGLSYEERQHIKNPFFGIITFKPYLNWYAK